MRNKVILIILAFILVACQKENKAAQYLACYALEPSSKQICVQKLAEKYITEDKRLNEQYKYEKLGFKEFLNQQNLACNHIKEGVLYDSKKQAYRIKCQSGHEYFMKFDYEIKSWNIEL